MVPPPPAVGAVALHGGSKWLKLAKNKFTWSDFTNFSKQVQQIPFPVVASPHIENLSNCCRHKYDQSISRIFKNLIFGMFLTFSPNTSDQAVLFSAAKSPRSSLQPLWLTDMGRRRPYKLAGIQCSLLKARLKQVAQGVSLRGSARLLSSNVLFSGNDLGMALRYFDGTILLYSRNLLDPVHRPTHTMFRSKETRLLTTFPIWNGTFNHNHMYNKHGVINSLLQ